MKSMYDKRRAARQLEVRRAFTPGWRIMDMMLWIVRRLMKRVNEDCIMHGWFVIGMVHASTSDALKRRFLDEYKGDIEITCEDLMTSILGMEGGQDEDLIRLKLVTYTQETLDEYKSVIKKLPEAEASANAAKSSARSRRMSRTPRSSRAEDTSIICGRVAV
jgi:hypothetical protein